MLALAGCYAGLHVALLRDGRTLGDLALVGTQLCVVLLTLIGAVVGHSHRHRPIARGRIVAIIPAFEERPDALNRCIRSILDQVGAVVDEVHVVDDGSTEHPVQPWQHPRVSWHRKPNGGKRSAQHLVLSLLAQRPESVDFILTVDSDSQLDPDAVAQLLRAMSDPRVTAASGTVFVANADHNLITRLAEINIGASVTVARIGMSLLGTLPTTSGALAIYRACIPLRRRDDYLASGTFGDDRRLTLYAELEGRVVSVPDAVVRSAMPTTARGTYRQQLRWAKSRWANLGFTLTNMPARHLVFPIITLIRLMLFPTLIAVLAAALWATPGADATAAAAITAAIWINWRYAWVGLYLLRRTDQPLRRRLLTWAFLTPLETFYCVLFLIPIQYIALLKVRDHRWGTRPTAPPAYPLDPVAPRA